MTSDGFLVEADAHGRLEGMCKFARMRERPLLLLAQTLYAQVYVSSRCIAIRKLFVEPVIGRST